ncbi:hypothetical protein BC826DRAFT_1103354 [Russula brevipes]|nr:hypothetical protein BC826DRAFT_1103354 [Russula brevipes]
MAFRAVYFGGSYLVTLAVAEWLYDMPLTLPRSCRLRVLSTYSMRLLADWFLAIVAWYAPQDGAVAGHWHGWTGGRRGARAI